MSNLKIKIGTTTPSKQIIDKHKNFNQFMDQYAAQSLKLIFKKTLIMNATVFVTLVSALVSMRYNSNGKTTILSNMNTNTVVKTSVKNENTKLTYSATSSSKNNAIKTVANKPQQPTIGVQEEEELVQQEKANNASNTTNTTNSNPATNNAKIRSMNNTSLEVSNTTKNEKQKVAKASSNQTTETTQEENNSNVNLGTTIRQNQPNAIVAMTDKRDVEVDNSITHQSTTNDESKTIIEPTTEIARSTTPTTLENADVDSVKNTSVETDKLVDEKPVVTEPIEDKKYAVGGGISYLADINDPVNIGLNFKFDFLQNKKLGFGIKTIINTYRFKNYNGTSFSTKSKPGAFLNTMATATYYLLGNYYQSKAGLYLTLGIGGGITQSVTNYEYAASNENFTHKDTEYGIVSIGGIGADVKIGKGKLFLELMATPNIYTTISRKEIHAANNTSYINSSDGEVFYPNNAGGDSKFTTTFNNSSFIVNLGYTYCFGSKK